MSEKALTLEELREMEDEPIYIDYGKFICCAFVNEVLDDVIWIFDKTEGFLMLPTSTLGKDWFAYRRNPEKEHNCNG